MYVIIQNLQEELCTDAITSSHTYILREITLHCYLPMYIRPTPVKFRISLLYKNKLVKKANKKVRLIIGHNILSHSYYYSLYIHYITIHHAAFFLHKLPIHHTKLHVHYSMFTHTLYTSFVIFYNKLLSMYYTFGLIMGC